MRIAEYQATLLFQDAASLSGHNRLSVFAIACFGGLLLIIGSWAVAQEGQSYLLHGVTALSTINSRPENAPTGLGINARRDVLQECEITLRSAKSFELMLKPQIDFADLRDKCSNIALSIVQQAPTYSLAWVVAAQAAAVAGQWPQMNRYIAMSQQTAPNEQWIGQIRFQIADRNFSQLAADVRPLYDADMRMLILSNKGIPYIARQYVLNAEFRQRITQVLEKMEVADQRRYISVLRRMVPR